MQFRRAGGPYSSKSDTGPSDYCQSVGKVQFEHFLQAFALKCDDGFSSGRIRSKQDPSRMLTQRVALPIGDAFVEREQDPIGGEGGIHNRRSAAPRSPSWLTVSTS
jgi:hypothetical protein